MHLVQLAFDDALRDRLSLRSVFLFADQATQHHYRYQVFQFDLKFAEVKRPVYD